jgi:hypothetical protein
MIILQGFLKLSSCTPWGIEPQLGMGTLEHEKEANNENKSTIVTNYKLLSIASKKDAGLLMVTFIT